MKNTAEQKAEKRLRLKRAAVRAFLRHGFSHTTMNHIATEAGMTKGNIYSYFSSKRELFADIVEPVRKEIAVLIASGYEMIFEENRLNPQILRDNIASAAALFHRNRDETLLLFEANDGSPYAGLKETVMDELFSRILDLTREQADREGRTIVKGDIYFRLLAMFWIEAFLTAIRHSDTEEGIREAIAESVQIVFDSIRRAVA